jgi:hypothetical protein
MYKSLWTCLIAKPKSSRQLDNEMKQHIASAKQKIASHVIALDIMTTAV